MLPMISSVRLLSEVDEVDERGGIGKAVDNWLWLGFFWMFDVENRDEHW